MAENKERLQKELELATEMKERFCDASGKEKNVEKAAEIIHQIGLIYRRPSLDKISLIQSAGLFNAAILRNPPSVSQIKSDLSELCQHVLKQAKAKNQNADLIKKGQEVKISFNQLRAEVEEFLKTKVPLIPNDATKNEKELLNAQKIAAIQQINKKTAGTYKLIMADLSRYCEEVMGKPPCKYAIVGMGSLARKEITPYSDFEHVILLLNCENYEMHLEYFRWFTTIFHIIVLNIQETIIPSLNIRSLNSDESSLGDWYYDAITPRGISFDGMMPHACKFPLGRQQHTQNKQFTNELIKPVNEMLEYLSSDADLKNGYHLADILTKTCFVYGSNSVFKQFVDGAKNYLDKKSVSDTIDDIRKQVQEDLDKFSTRFRLTKLKSQNTINIKQLVYRSSTLFISALARKHNISATSCFDIIEHMTKNQKITQNTAEKLNLAIAIACEIRLRVYTNNKSQCDNAIDLGRNGIKEFLDIVGEASSVNYFQIAYCLQREIAKQLNFTKLHFYSHPELLNIAISVTFEINDSTKLLTNPQHRFWDSTEFNFYKCINALETKTNEDSETSVNFNRSNFNKAFLFLNGDSIKSLSFNWSNADQHKRLISFADYLLSLHLYDDALDLYEYLLDMVNTNSSENYVPLYVALLNHQIGSCLRPLNRHTEALRYLEQSLEIKKNPIYPDQNESIGATHYVIAQCQNDMEKYGKALNHLRLSLQKFENTKHDPEKVRIISMVHYEIGRCHNNSKNHNGALKHLQKSLQLDLDTTVEAIKDRSIGLTFFEIGRAYHHLKNYDKALKNLDQSLQILDNSTENADKDRNIGLTLQGIGKLHKDLKNYGRALTHLERSLQIAQNTTLKADTDKSISAIRFDIGQCYISLKDYNMAVTFLERSLQIAQNTTPNKDEDEYIGVLLNEIGRCHYNLEHYDDALTHLNQSLQIFQNTKQNADKDEKIGGLLYEVGLCHGNLKHFDDALTFLNQSLQIFQKTTLHADKDENIGVLLYEIGKCHHNLEHYDDALTFLNQSFQIFQNVSSNAEKNNHTILLVREMIDRCEFLSHLNSQPSTSKCLKKLIEIPKKIVQENRRH